METLIQYVGEIIVFFGALTGSIKASAETGRGKALVVRLVDIMLGVFVGTALAHHYGTTEQEWLRGLLALVGGVSGTLVIEVFLQMLPRLARDMITKICK